SKWRVSFADSGPLSRRLTRSLAGNGFAREYGGAATVASACIKQTSVIRNTRQMTPNLQTRISRIHTKLMQRLTQPCEVRDNSCNWCLRKFISPPELSVISDCQSWTNVQCALSSRHFLWRFGLFKKMNASLVAVVRYKIWRFLKTETAQRAARVHIPLSRRVLGLIA